MTLIPLRWDKVRAGEYTATDRDGNDFLIRKQSTLWVVYVNNQKQSFEWKLAAAKRYVEAIARKHSSALRAR